MKVSLMQTQPLIALRHCAAYTPSKTPAGSGCRALRALSTASSTTSPGSLGRGIQIAFGDTGLQKMPSQALDGILFAHGGQFLFGAVALRVADKVTGKTVGHAFKQIRAIPVTQAGDGPARLRIDGEQIIAIDGARGHLVGLREASYEFHRRVFLAACEFRVAVVFTYKEDGQLPEYRQIERLMEGARAGGTIAEEHDADIRATQRLRRPGRACSQGKVAGDDTRGSHHPVRHIDQMHRTASTAAQAGLPPQHLRECRLDVAAFGENVTVTPMTGKEHIVAREL